MKLQTTSPSVPELNDKTFVRDLYNRYGGMLLGYLTDVLGERREAERYLVEIFNEIPHHIREFFTAEKSAWVQLQNLAKHKLTPFVSARQDCKQVDAAIQQKWTMAKSNLTRLSDAQRSVFCGVYYHHKSLAVLAEELNQPQTVIKTLLKEAFNMIRNGR